MENERQPIPGIDYPRTFQEMVCTDGWCGYSGLAAAGYRHQVTVITSGAAPAHEVMPRVHLVASLLKRWLIGTHQGGVQHQHLDYYLDEFTFRFNRRRSRLAGCSFIASPNSRLPSLPPPTTQSSGPAPMYLGEGDTQLVRFVATQVDDRLWNWQWLLSCPHLGWVA